MMSTIDKDTIIRNQENLINNLLEIKKTISKGNPSLITHLQEFQRNNQFLREQVEYLKKNNIFHMNNNFIQGMNEQSSIFQQQHEFKY